VVGLNSLAVILLNGRKGYLERLVARNYITMRKERVGSRCRFGDIKPKQLESILLKSTVNMDLALKLLPAHPNIEVNFLSALFEACDM